VDPDCGGEESQPMTRDIYERLKEVARAGRTITYGEIAPMAELDMSNPVDRNEIAAILVAISTTEHQEGRPLLSAVVVRSDTRYPGKGFFKLAQDLGIYDRSDDLAFFVQELARVHEYWMKAKS